MLKARYHEKIFLLEFAMAQTPNRMRGIMMGLMIAMSAWSSIGSTLITSIMRIFKASEQKYILYSCLALPPLAMLMLIILLIAAKRYKLRDRERHVSSDFRQSHHYSYSHSVRSLHSKLHSISFVKSVSTYSIQ